MVLHGRAPMTGLQAINPDDRYGYATNSRQSELALSMSGPELWYPMEYRDDAGFQTLYAPSALRLSAHQVAMESTRDTVPAPVR